MENLPSGRIVVFIRNHVVYIEDTKVFDTFDSIYKGMKHIHNIWLPPESEETLDSMWKRILETAKPATKQITRTRKW